MFVVSYFCLSNVKARSVVVGVGRSVVGQKDLSVSREIGSRWQYLTRCVPASNNCPHLINHLIAIFDGNIDGNI